MDDKLNWIESPKNVFVVKRIGETAQDAFIEILNYLIHMCDLNVFIEETEYECTYLRTDEGLYDHEYNFYNKKLKKLDDNNIILIDFIICLGGDGTLLHVSQIFPNYCPPVLSIHFGSMGFLCPFEFDNYQEYINSTIRGDVPVVQRRRIRCKLEPIDSGDSYTIYCKNESQQEYVALNEIVINRGSHTYLSNLDLYINDDYLTSIQGDGLIISTPTGSTAYAMSTGASLCHPSVQSITITSICPHSLTFRPIVVPFEVDIKVCLNSESRCNAFFSIDGKNLNELKHGYFLHIHGSGNPIPTLARSDQIRDWFDSLSTCLNWNQRLKQQSLNGSKMNVKLPFMTKTSTSYDFKSLSLCVPNFDFGYVSNKSDDSDCQP